MLNRCLLVIKFKQPFLDWTNEVDPNPNGYKATLEDANDDSPAFLIPDSSSEDIEDWLDEFYLPIFENVLEEWYIDDSLWPQDRTLALFKAWCDYEMHSVVIDLVDGPLEDDDYDE